MHGKIFLLAFGVIVGLSSIATGQSEIETAALAPPIPTLNLPECNAGNVQLLSDLACPLPPSAIGRTWADYNSSGYVQVRAVIQSARSASTPTNDAQFERGNNRVGIRTRVFDVFRNAFDTDPQNTESVLLIIRNQSADVVQSDIISPDPGLLGRTDNIIAVVPMFYERAAEVGSEDIQIFAQLGTKTLSPYLSTDDVSRLSFELVHVVTEESDAAAWGRTIEEIASNGVVNDALKVSFFGRDVNVANHFAGLSRRLGEHTSDRTETRTPTSFDFTSSTGSEVGWVFNLGSDDTRASNIRLAVFAEWTDSIVLRQCARNRSTPTNRCARPDILNTPVSTGNNVTISTIIDALMSDQVVALATETELDQIEQKCRALRADIAHNVSLSEVDSGLALYAVAINIGLNENELASCFAGAGVNRIISDFIEPGSPQAPITVTERQIGRAISAFTGIYQRSTDVAASVWFFAGAGSGGIFSDVVAFDERLVDAEGKLTDRLYFAGIHREAIPLLLAGRSQFYGTASICATGFIFPEADAENWRSILFVEAGAGRSPDESADGSGSTPYFMVLQGPRLVMPGDNASISSITIRPAGIFGQGDEYADTTWDRAINQISVTANHRCTAEQISRWNTRAPQG